MKKKKLLLIALSIILVSCEQNDSIINSGEPDASGNKTTVITRGDMQPKATTQLAMDPIKQIKDQNIPVHIMLSEPNHPYRYLSCSTNWNVDLWKEDDNSGRQKWILKPTTMPGVILQPFGGIKGGTSNLTVGVSKNRLKLSRYSSTSSSPTVSFIRNPNTNLYIFFPYGYRNLIMAENYNSNSLKEIPNSFGEQFLPLPTNQSPLAYFLIIPDQEFTLIGISYDFITGDNFEAKPNRVIHKGFRNNFSEPINRTITISESLTNSSTFQETTGLSVSTTVKTNFSVGIGKIFGGSVDVSTTTTANWTYSTTETETRNFTISENFNVTVPPGRAVDFELIWTEYTLDITYIAKLKSNTTPAIIYLPGRWKGVTVQSCDIVAFDPDNQEVIDRKTVENKDFN